ncbi:hypothetical protein K474DRAFT_1600932 [Panus rudis PR-1116 ss-1]|nr:hypothetical protein K474DRAFT_1600932 [Panus rudis PR-1116 ss-1]
MKECGAANVPLFSALRKKQEQLVAAMDLRSTHHVSALGNEFYANGPAQTFRLDWANPLVRPYIRPYVEVSPKLSEFYQGERLLNEDVDFLQQMWADFEHAPKRHFYIGEIAQLSDGNLVVPMKWVCVLDSDGRETECADVLPVKHDKDSGRTVIDNSSAFRLEARTLQANYLELLDEGYVFKFDEWVGQMPHPVREIAKGRPTYTLSLMTWADDVSGNWLKQYNPHTNVYLANLNLPHGKLHQEYFVRFCSTSPHASALEQLEVITKETGKDTWYEAYDCQHEEEILFRIISRLKPADNPQQSELCSHIGLRGSHFCRRCGIGGDAGMLETQRGYEQLFAPGIPRTKDTTLTAIHDQFDMACAGEDVANLQKESGVKDAIAQHWIEQIIPKAKTLYQERIQRDSRLNDHRLNGEARKAIKADIKIAVKLEMHEWIVKQPPDRYEMLPLDSGEIIEQQLRPGDHYNPLLGYEGLDVHRDTPLETLHTYSLGQTKYVWHKTYEPMNNDDLDELAIRLESSSVDGLSIFPVRGRYLVKYKNALVGKHYKTLQQVGIFHVSALLSRKERTHGLGENGAEKLIKLWRVTGELGALLWYHSIDNLEEYLIDLGVLIDNVLDVWAAIDPRRIIVKAKLHTLTHAASDIRNHGPAPLFSTEIFECWNAIFRLCSNLSNHHAPSRDIAESLASLERFKHLASGGFWKTTTGEYVSASENIARFLCTRKELQRRLGWAEKSNLVPDSFTMDWSAHLRQAGLPLNLDEPVTIACDDSGALPTSMNHMWQQAQHVVSESGDICREKSWVFFQRLRKVSPIIPRILVPVPPRHSCDAQSDAVILVENFIVSSEADEKMNMPVLTRPNHNVHESEPDVMFIFNAQHDCASAQCGVDGITQERQERRLTSHTVAIIKHQEPERYFINMHGLHNAQLICSALPRALTKPTHIWPNRTAEHLKHVEELSRLGPQLRAQAAAKAKETRARNKAAKEAQSRGRGAEQPEVHAGDGGT